MLPGHKYTPEIVGRILLRRWWIVLVPFVVGTAGGILLFKRLPPKYRSETLITVVPQRVPDSYVRSTVTARVEDRLSSISDEIMSRSRLERIIVDLNLYKDQRARGIMEDVVQRMRDDIQVKLESKESFRVSYINADPNTARAVTERLASLYIEENLRDREELANSTNQFIESQLVDAKRQLVAQEKKLEEYRRRYAGQLPSQLPGNLQTIQSAQMQLQSLNESMNRARERRLLIERQLADAQSYPVAVGLQGAPVAGADAAASVPAAQQLEAAKAQLEAAQRRYTDDHPDIRALKRTIRGLEARVERESLEASKAPAVKAMRPEELVRQKRIGDLQAELQVVDRQLSASGAEETQLRRVIADLQAKVDVLPTRESELVELTRDYSTLQETYASLLGKREESKLAANLEHRQIGEQFRILDPASLPQRPYNQNQRLGAAVGGALGGLAIGLALVGLLEYRDSSFKSEEDILRVLSLPVLALVPMMGTPAARGRQGSVATGGADDVA